MRIFGFNIDVGWTLAVGAFSVFMLLGSVLLAFRVVMRIPANYFQDEKHPSARLNDSSRNVSIIRKIMKNVLGIILIVAGIAMLVLPGQGVLTILAGLLFMDFPGKYRIERKLASIPALLSVINAIRRKGGHPPLSFKSK